MVDVREEAMDKVKKWTVEGYDVGPLIDIVNTGSEDDVDDLLADYTARIIRLKRADKTLKREDIVLLSSMDTAVYNSVREIKKIMRDLEKVAEVESSVKALERLVNERQLGSRMRGLVDGITEQVADDKGRGEKVSDIFVVYNDGRLLYHQTLEGSRSIDTDILSGMLTAIQDFVRHCLQYDSGSFKKLEYGSLKVVVETGKNFYVAFITSGAADRDINKVLRNIVGKIESRWGETLDFWDGDVGSIRGIGTIVKQATHGDETKD